MIIRILNRLTYSHFVLEKSCSTPDISTSLTSVPLDVMSSISTWWVNLGYLALHWSYIFQMRDPLDRFVSRFYFNREVLDSHNSPQAQ